MSGPNRCRSRTLLPFLSVALVSATAAPVSPSALQPVAATAPAASPALVPVTSAGTLSLSIGEEVTEFQVTHCRTDRYEAGATPGTLVVLAELTAVGTFRGRPATVFMAKSEGAQFENLDLYLTELSAEERTMPTLEALNTIRANHTKTWGAKEAELNGAFQRSLEEGDLNFDEMSALSDALSEQLDAVRAEADLALPWARLFGEITVDGAAIRFEGSGQTSVHPRDDSLNPLVPELRGLGNGDRAVARCEG